MMNFKIQGFTVPIVYIMAGTACLAFFCLLIIAIRGEMSKPAPIVAMIALLSIAGLVYAVHRAAVHQTAKEQAAMIPVIKAAQAQGFRNPSNVNLMKNLLVVDSNRCPVTIGFTNLHGTFSFYVLVSGSVPGAELPVTSSTLDAMTSCTSIP